MTIEIVRGDIFRSGCDALVCAANAWGIMGAGHALEVARRYPEQSDGFERLVQSRKPEPGSVLVGLEGMSVRERELEALTGKPAILFALVKDNPRVSSRIDWVIQAIARLVVIADKSGLPSVAVPALGCGLGGLRWDDVRPMLVEAFRKAPAVRWKLYAPLEPAQLAEAVALRLGSRTVRTNVSHGQRTRVYLTRERTRLGWITVDPGWGLHASDDAPAAYKEMAEDVKREMLEAMPEEVLERVD